MVIVVPAKDIDSKSMKKPLRGTSRNGASFAKYNGFTWAHLVHIAHPKHKIMCPLNDISIG